MRVLLFFLFPGLLFAAKLSLSGGLGLNAVALDSLNGGDPLKPGWGFHSHATFRVRRWDLGVSGYANFSQSAGVVTAEGTQIQADFDLRSMSFGPTATYYTDWQPFKAQRFSFFGGPLLSIMTLKPQNPRLSGGSYDPSHKLTYSGQGFIIGLGLGERVPQKKQRFFYSLSYKFLRYDEVHIIEGDRFEITSEKEEPLSSPLYIHALMLSFGFTLF